MTKGLALERIRSRLGSTIAHELSSLVQIQEMYLDRFEGLQNQGSMSGELAQSFCALRKITDQMKGVIVSMRALDTDGQAIQKKPEDVAGLVKEHLRLHQVKFEKLKVTVELSKGVLTELHEIAATEILQVLTIFINNALEAVVNKQEGERKIRVSLSECASWLSLEVFSPTQLPKNLKESLGQTPLEHSPKESGWGLGLCIARVVLERAGGELGFREDVEGVTFYSMWPLAAQVSEKLA